MGSSNRASGHDPADSQIQQRDEILVRALEQSDEGAFRQLYRDYLLEHSPSRADLLAATAWQALMSGTTATLCLVCVRSGEIDGLAVGVLHDDIPYGGTACYLEDLYVRPRSRRQGVATALLTQFKAAVQECGWTRLHWSSSNPVADALYRRYADDAEAGARYVIWGSGQ